MKILIVSPVLYAFWQAPTYSLLAIVALLFIVQVIGELMSFKTPTNDSYEEIKELFSQIDEITSKDIYLEDREKEASTKLEVVPVEIKCMPAPNFSEWAYADLSTLCRLMGLKPSSRKKLKLIESLESLL